MISHVWASSQHTTRLLNMNTLFGNSSKQLGKLFSNRKFFYQCTVCTLLSKNGENSKHSFLKLFLISKTI